jgi:transposase
MIDKKDSINSTLWVAIDVAKNKHIVLVEHPNGTRKELKIMNTQNDFKRLASYINKNNLAVVVGLESTGYYHRAIAYFLLQQNFQVRLISSLAASKVREAQFNAWDKNDSKDASVILYLLKSGISQYYHEPMVHKLVDIQELCSTYRQISFRKTQLQHSIINHYLALYFPEAEKYFCSTRAEWFALFFEKFACPAAITQYDFEKFIKVAWKLAGRKIDKLNWLRDVYETAKTSIGLPVAYDSLAMDMFRLILREFWLLCQRRKELEELANDHLKECPDYHRLKTIPGIGPIIALTILAEAGDIRRFDHWRQFIKYCGFDLCTHQSGKYRGSTKLSKRGNGNLRKMFWLAATTAIRMRENTFRKKYENYIKENPNDSNLKRKSYTAVAAKIARVAYSLIKYDTDYRCTFESQ